MTTSLSLPEQSRAWWKESTVYQIYPISFFDSNGDGFGDLNGISSKLDYLKDLGVDVLWLSPIYRSPLADMGYDIADYRAIDPRYGTLEDWDNLLKGVHDRGMKLMMDLVVNHTSDEHDWFVQSRASKINNPKRDWYIWRPPKYDSEGNRQPPNNWKSVFQGSAWEYDAETEEYYLHLYVAKQPDLNWENPEVRKAVWDLMKFWLDRGCDGFRMDVINLISKVEGLPDAPVVDPKEKYQPASVFWANGPRVHEFIKEMNTKVLSHYDLITVGEAPFTHSESELAKYVLPDSNELNMVFQFELMDIDAPALPNGQGNVSLRHRDWKLSEFKEVVGKWQKYKRDEGFWNAIYIDNHDHARSVSRYGNDSTDELQAISAKMLAISQITQSGTLYVYQGEELGLKNFPRTWGIEEYKDVASQNYYNKVLKQRQKEAGGNAEIDMSDVLDGFQKKARDHCRTPIPWNSRPQGGFTSGEPWMRVNDDFKKWNASSQINEESSVFSFWKRALQVRKDYDVLIYGSFEILSPGNEQVFAYTKSLPSSTALVLLNFTGEDVKFVFDSEQKQEWEKFRLVLGNYEPANAIHENGLLNDEGVALRKYEGRVYIRA